VGEWHKIDKETEEEEENSGDGGLQEVHGLCVTDARIVKGIRAQHTLQRAQPLFRLVEWMGRQSATHILSRPTQTHQRLLVVERKKHSIITLAMSRAALKVRFWINQFEKVEKNIPQVALTWALASICA
jgi:hypothetical protein